MLPLNESQFFHNSLFYLQKYAITVSKQVGIKGPQSSTGTIGTQLTFNEIDTLFSEDQLVQLFDLYNASTGIPDMKESPENPSDIK